ncbi:MAG: hypothetical protein ACHQF3_00670 [Alphaproteobacteria bacterium]
MPPKDWKEPLARFATKAGFATAQTKHLSGAPELPAGAILWRSSYAQLLALPLAEANEQSLRDAARIGQEWLDVASMEQERADHQVFDAYLLLISSNPVLENLFSLVSEIELDPTACRKHVAWPETGLDTDVVWRRMLRVTVLGLPASPTASGMTNTPLLVTDFEKNLLKDVKALKGRAAAHQHAEQPLPDDAS